MARPMATRWLWPPDSWLGRRFSRCSICRISAALATRAVDLGLGRAQVLEAEAQVLLDAHMRVERVGLEHHRHAARRRQQVVAALAVDVDLAGADLLEAGDHPQQRGLAAAGRADEDGEGAVVDREVDAVDHFERLEALPDVPEFDRRHHATVDCPGANCKASALRVDRPALASRCTPRPATAISRDVEAAAEHARASVALPCA